MSFYKKLTQILDLERALIFSEKCKISTPNKCHVLLQVPKLFVLVQFVLVQPKMELHVVLVQNIFCSGTKSLGLAQCVNQFLVWHETFGSAQNILGPVEGQCRRFFSLIFFENLHFQVC